jgi:hypothetical protein
MKRHSSLVRNLALAALSVAGLAAFAAVTRDAQEPCTGVNPSTSCIWSGAMAYFSSDASGSIEGDTLLDLDAGAMYITPIAGANDRKGYVRTTHRTTEITMLSAEDPTYLNISYPTSSVVALLQGTLPPPPTLQPGCQITYTVTATGYDSTFSTIPSSDSLLTWFGETFELTIPSYPSPSCN